MGLGQKIWGNIGSWVSGVLQPSAGGTGATTLADGGIVIGNGTSAVEVVTPGATTEILVGGGAATKPVWTTATGTGAPVRATSPALTTPDIDGGTLDGALLGATKTNIQKGPAIINSGFAGTVGTGGVSTKTVVFSSAADAILAGYNATNPILGTTLIAGGNIRYIVSWNSSTSCEVDSVVTLANGTAITSVQLPIAVFVDSSGTRTGWMLANGQINLYSSVIPLTTSGASVQQAIFQNSLTNGNTQVGIDANGNSARVIIGANYGVKGYIGTIDAYPFDLISGNAIGLRITPTSLNILTGGLTAAGTNAAKVLAMGSGTAPTTSPADAAQMWVADQNGVAGKAALHLRDETGVVHTFGANIGIATTAPTSTIHGAGSFALPITTKTADYTAGASDYTILVSCSSANITITLPAASGCSGRIYNVKKIDATGYTVTVDGNSSETIDGALTQVISTQYESLQIQSSGSVWYIL